MLMNSLTSLNGGMRRPNLKFSMERKKLRSQNKQFLLSYLKVVLDSKDWEEAGRVREQLDILIKEDAWGFVVRSRFQQNVEAERASLFHARKELKNAKNSLSSLRVQDRITTNQGEIDTVHSWKNS